MKPCPDIIGLETVIQFTPIDERHIFTGNTKQIVAGKLMGAMKGLAITSSDGGRTFLLLGCDEDWNSITDTWHQSVEDAVGQAEFEYTGTRATWVKK